MTQIYIRFLVLLLVLLPFYSYSQQVIYPFNTINYIELDKVVQQQQINLHTGIKPLFKNDLMPYVNTDSILYRQSTDQILPRKFYNSWFWRKFRNENFYTNQHKDIRISINPLLTYELGRDRSTNQSYLMNTRGIYLQAEFGDKFGFYTSFFENQATYPEYINQFINQVGMVPGQGAPKLFADNGHDFSRAEAYLSYRPYKWITLHLGQGRNFIGEGYRSLLLSDNVAAYPFFKTTLRMKKVQLTTLFTQFTDFGIPTQVAKVWHYSHHYKRHSSMTYLSYRPNKRLEIGLFEGIMWQSTDTVTQTYNKNEKSFFSPIPLIRTASNGFNGKHNVLMGLNAKLRITKSIQAYGQIMIDDIALDKSIRDKYGFQAGAKYWDVAGIKNLFLQAEYNQVRPYSYSHTIQRVNWTHSNQALAHPLGANFKELILFTAYRWRDFRLQFRYSNANMGTDTSLELTEKADDIITQDNWGSNIYLSNQIAPQTTNIEQGQGLKTTLTYLSGQVAWVINPRTNLQIYLSVQQRNWVNTTTNNSIIYIGFGVKSAMENFYFDF